MSTRFAHAFAGLRLAFSTSEILGHLLVASLVIVAGLLACLDRTGWLLVIGAIGVVLTAETLNTAVEETLDLVSPRRSERVRRAKDLAAAAVVVAALAAAIIGVSLFLPPVLSGTFGRCLFLPLSGTIDAYGS